MILLLSRCKVKVEFGLGLWASHEIATTMFFHYANVVLMPDIFHGGLATTKWKLEATVIAEMYIAVSSC